MASNLWVAVGSGGTGNSIVTSSDGNTWTSTGSTVIGASAIAYKNNLWVAVGYSGNNIATSTDGVLWTGRGSTMFSGSSGKCVASGKDGSGNNLWVAGGYYSIASSPDGITWTHRSSLFAYANGIAYGNGLWIAAGSCNPVNTIATSTNGITWTLRSAGFGWGSANAVAYGRDGSGNRLWVAVGASSSSPVDSIMSSTDGINWLYCTQCFYQGYGVAYGQDGSGNKLWVAVGYGANTIATSTNGTIWTGRGATVFPSQGKSVTYANGLWVATGDSGNTIATSTNGINWTVKNNPLTGAYGIVGPTKATLLTNYYFPTKKIGDASFNIIPPTSNNYGAFTYTSSNTSVATIVGSKINVVGVGTSTITAVQEETFSYLSGTNTATFQVIQSTEGTETVLSDFSVPTKIIGDASFDIVAPTTNSDGAFIYTSSNIAVATIVGSTVTIVGVGTSTISAIQLMTSTYASATITAPLVVNQITTVLSNFSVPTKTFGDVSFGIIAPTTNGNGTFSYASSDTTVFTISGNRITIVGGGSSTITATQASTTNYTSATITAPITVNQATTVVSNFSIGQKTITDMSFTIPSITTNSTGLFTYTSSDPTVATIAGNVATIVGIGSATITADQASNANFLAATISTTLNVSRNLWVAVGYGTGNTVASSYDGITWKGLGLGGAPQSIAYSNNLWVAVGGGPNTLAYSTTNGNTWTGFGYNVFSSTGYRILYDPSAALWIAIGKGGNSIATSTNPKTSWIGQGPIFSPYFPVNCLYGPAIYSETQNFSAYLLGGYSTGSLLAYSLNGTTWQMGTGTSTSLASQGFNTIAYGNGVYVAGCNPTGSGNSFATSTDQISWTGRGGSTKMSNVSQIAYGNGMFIAVGTKGTAGSSIMKSTDGVTWTNMTGVFNASYFRCVAYYQGRWFVGGDFANYGIYYSDDNGTTWTNPSSSYYIFSNQVNSIACGYGVVVSVGQGTGNTLAISTDFGASWSGKGLLLTGYGNDVKYNNGVWLAVGGDNVSTGNVIVKSTNNGTTWTPVAIYNTSYFTSVNGVQNVNGTWYITGRGAYYLAYSNTNNPSSMSDFTLVSTSSVSFSTNGVCLSTFNYQKPRYIVGGQEMKGSVDGFSWFDILNQPFTTVNDVYWNGTIWVGVGVCLMPVPYGTTSYVRNTIAYSYDGINWIGLGATIFTIAGNNVYYSTANSLWIATGSGTNTIATSVDGITWTGRGTTVFTTAGGRITYDNNLLVAVGEGFNNFATSTDGISWDIPTRLNSGYHVTYINNAWFIIGSPNSGQNIIAKSTNGFFWKDVTIAVSNGTSILSSGSNIAYGNGKWVACGRDDYNKGGIMYSTDGTNWTGTPIISNSTNFVITNTVQSVAYGNNLWVAVGTGGNSIATSTDGITWTGRGQTVFTTNGNNVAYANGLWVAGGYGGNSIATSVDGITWTGRGSTALMYGYSVAYGKDGSGNGLWVAVGTGLGFNIATSSDGITWTGRGNTGGGSYSMNDVAYGNGLWIACNSSGNNATSTDGITWTLRSNMLPNTNYNLYSIAYANGLWVMTGYNSGVAMIATSTNSINWTQRNDKLFNGKTYDVVGPTTQVTKITTVLNNFSVPAKTVGDVSFSLVAPTSNSDGVITYTSSNIAVASIVDNVVTIVGGGTTTIRATQASTADYTTGTISATLTVTQITTVLTDFSVPTKTFGDVSFGIIAPTTSRDGYFAYSSSNSAVAMIGNGLIYVAVGSGANTIATSTDGLTWTGRGQTVFNIAGYGVAHENGLWVAVGQGGNTIASSTDGVTWTGRDSTVFTTSAKGVAYGKDASGNGVWVAVGSGGNTIVTSTDGITWTGRGATVFTTVGNNVTYANGLWVAVGSGGNAVATSTNGIIWTGRGQTGLTYGNSIAYGKDATGNGLWVGVGWQSGNSIATSTDGITWTSRSSGGLSYGGSGVAYGKDGSGNKLWVAVGPSSYNFATSVDGINWTSCYNNGVFYYLGTTYAQNVYYSNGLWIATGGSTTTNVGNSIATSTDGINWTGRGTSGLIYGSAAVTQGVIPVTTSNTITVVGAGSATITAVELATPDYAAATITAPFVVNQATPVMTNFSVPAKTFGDASFNIIPPVTNADGLITYTSSDTAVATISGTKIIIVGGGSATISANQAGTINFVPNSITATLQVNQAIPKITNFVVPSKVIESVPFTIVAPTTNSSGAFTYTSSDISVATIDGSMVTIVGKGTSTITAVQAITTNYLSGSITATLIVRLTPVITDFSVAAKTFGDASFSIIPPITDSDGTLTYTSSNIAVATVGGGLLYVAVGQSGNTIATSTDGITWIGRGANVFTTAGLSVAFGQDGSGAALWVAVGQGSNTIATSTDGIAWTGRGSSVITTQGRGIIYYNGLWVATGQGTNTIATSTNGTVWTGRGSTVFTNNTMGVAYGKDNLGNNLLVAIGNGGNTIASSTDGITWTGRGATVFTTTGWGIAYGKDAAGNGLWVAVGQGGNTIATSSNGTTWTGRSSVFSTRGWGIAYGKDGSGNNLWVAVGQDGNSIATSSDGISWTGRGTTIFTTSGYGVTYTDGLWVATGQGGNSVATSTNGTVWTGRGATVFDSGGLGVTKGGVPLALDAVTIVGAGTATITATQSLTANYVSGTITAPLVVIQATTVLSNFSVPTKTFGDGAFGIIAPTTNSNGVFTYTSSDTSVATIAGSTITIVGGGTATITANQASNTNFLSSSITATFQVNPATPIIAKFDIPVKTIGTAPFIIAPPTTNSNGIFSYTSSNAAVATIVGSMVTINGLGTTTITAVQSSTANFISATTSGILAVMDKVPLSIAVGSSNYGNTIATSTDLGLTWTGQGVTTFTASGSGVAGPANYDVSTVSISLYTIIDSSGIISTSEDGNTWTVRSSTGFTPGKCVAYANNTWLAGGNSGTGLSYSLDGVNWNKSNLTIPVSGLAYANNTWVAVGGRSYGTSSDGITWYSNSINLFVDEINDVAYGNNRWVAVGGNTYSGGTPITIYLSSDGSSWGQYGLGAFRVGRGIAYGNGQWVAVGSGFNTMVIANNTTIQTGNWVDLGSYLFTTSGWGVAFGKDGSGAGFWVAVGEGTNTIATSPDGMQWTGRGQTIFTTRGTKVRYYNNLWFAFGEGGNTFATSTNGINWVGSNKIRGSDIFYFSSTYTKPTYIAVGQGTNTIVGSTNGMTWRPPYNKPFFTAGYSIAWNGVQWMATGQGGNTIATSSNGIQWTGRDPLIFASSDVYGVTYANGLWVACATGANTIATSTDGITWTGRSVSAFTTRGIHVAYGKDSSGNGLWVAVGQGTNTIATSRDGFNWTGRGQTVIATQTMGIAYANGLWVAVGQGGNSIATSTDGITWTGRGQTIFTTQGTSVAYANNLWVAVGQGTNTIATSPDGILWTGRGQIIFTTQGTSVSYANNLWVAVGQGSNTIATSTDGIVWTGRGSTIFTTLGQDVTYANNLWVAVGEGTNTIATSTNGTVWTGRGATIFTNGFSVAYGNGLWVAGGRNAIATSTDGINWVGSSTTLSLQGRHAVYGKDSSNNNLWVAVGQSGNTITTSTNGIVWTGRGQTVFTTIGYSVAYGQDGSGNALWVAVGQGGNTIATSTNGTTWTGRGATVFTTYGYRVTYANRLWVAAGSGGNSIATSTDGITWTGFGTTVFTQGYGIKYTSNLWVAGGSGPNTIATSVDGFKWVGRGTTIFSGAGVDILGPTSIEPILILSVPLKNIGDAPFTITAPTSNSSGAITYTSSNPSVATIDGTTVTIVGIGSSTITAVQASTDYFISGTTTTNLIVENVKPAISNFVIPEKTFGDAAFTLVPPTSESSGEITYTSSNTAVATIVGNMITIVGGGNATITASQANAADYGSATITASLVVNQATTVLTNFSVPAKSFGNAPFTIVPPTTNSNGSITYTSSDTAVATVTGITITIVGTGTTTITANQASNANYTSTTIAATLTVGQATPTMTNFAAVTKTFGNAAFSLVAPTTNSTGLITYTSSNTDVATIAGNVVTIVSPGTSTITASQASTANYTTGTITAILTVNKITTVLSNFVAITKTVGDASFNLITPTSNSTGLFTYTSSNTAVATIVGNTITIVGGGTSTITASQATTTNFLAATITASITVNKATTVLTNFSVGIKSFGDASFNIIPPTTNSDGLITYTSSNTAAATISGNKITIVGVGTSTITATQATSTNYLSATTTSILTVNKGTPLLTNFSVPTKIIGNSAFTITPPTSNSTGGYTYTSSNTAVATIAGTTITIVGVGTSTITATQATTTNFLAGTTTATFTVNNVTPVITNFVVPVKTFGDASFSLVTPTSNSAGAFTYTSSNTAVATIVGNVVTIVGGGTSTISAIQASTASYVSGTATATLTVNATTSTITNFSVPAKVFGDASFALVPPTSNSTGSYTYTSSNTSVATIVGNTITIVGAGSSTITAIQASTASYISGSITATFQVGKGTPTLSFSVPTKTILDAAFTIDPPTSNSIGTFTYTSSDPLVATIVNGLVTMVGLGTATITAVQATSTNYIAATITATFQVIKATPTLTNFSMPDKTLGSSSFLITPPTSSSDGLFTYTSSDTSVATIIGNRISVKGVGTSTISAVQSSTAIYTSATISTSFQVILVTAVLSIPPFSAKTFGNIPFKIQSLSNSNGAINYTSSDLSVAAIIGDMITIVGAGSSTITASQESWNNYASASTTQTLQINPLTTVLSNFSVPAKKVGDATFTISPPSSNRIGAFTYTSSDISVATIDGNMVTVVGAGSSTITATQTSTTNFIAETITATLLVGQTTSVLTFAVPTKTFGDAPFMITPPSTISDGLITYTSSNPAIAAIAGNMVTIIGAGNVTITASQASTANYAFAAITAPFVINKSAPNLTNFVVPAKKVGDAPFSIVAPTTNGVGGFSYTSSNTAVATIVRNVVTIVGIGSATITAIQASTVNFLSGTITATLEVTQSISTLSNFVVPVKKIGDAAFTLTPPTTKSDGLITYTSSDTEVATIVGDVVTIVGAGTSSITASQASTPNYASGTITATLTVNLLTTVLTNFDVSANQFGTAAFTLVPPTSNRLGAFTYASSDTNIAMIEGDVVTIVGAGTSTISAVQTSANNYASATITDILYVNKAQPVLTDFIIPTQIIGDDAFTITPPTSNSDGDFTYTSSNTAVATVVDDVITIVGLGTATITALQASTINYISRPITTLFQVKLIRTVLTNFSVSTKIIGDASFAIVPPTTNSDGEFIYTSSNLLVATIAGNMVSVVGVGNTTITAFQESTYNSTPALISAPFVVNKNSPTLTNFIIPEKAVSDATFKITPPTTNGVGAFSYTSSNTAVATIVKDVVTIVGIGSSTITAVQASTANFISGSITATLQVTQSSAMLTNFIVPAKMVGDTAFTLTPPTTKSDGLITYTSSNTEVATITGNVVTILGFGSSTITASQASTPNFASATITAPLVVSKLTTVLTNFSVPATQFGNAAFTLVPPTSNSDGLITYTSSNTAVATIVDNVVTIVGGGTSTITASQASTASYLSRTITATLTVTQIKTVLSNFVVPEKIIGDAPFTVTPPTTNSDGLFTYTSTNTSVATVEGDVITIVGLGISSIIALQTGTANYTTRSITETLQVNPLITLLTNFSVVSKSFGDASFAIVPPTSNSDGEFTYTSSNPLVATIAEDIITIVGVGTSTITAVSSSTPTSTFAKITAPFVVNKNSPGLTNFVVSEKTFGNAAFTITPPTTNGVGAFTYTSSNTEVATIVRNIVTIVGVGSSTITAVQASTASFISETITATFTVGQGTPTLSNFNIPTKKSVDAPFTITPPTTNSNGLITYTSSDTSVATIDGNTITIVGGGSSTITATQSSTANYTSGTITALFTVGQISTVITNFSGITKQFGNEAFAIPPPTTNSNGLITYTSSNTAVATIVGNIVTIVGGGTSIITASQASTASYAAATVTTTLQVSQIATVLSNFSVPAKALGDAAFMLTPPTTNGNGVFTYRSSNTSVATIDGNMMTIVGAGSSIITAVHPNTNNYTSETITASLTVGKGTPILTNFVIPTKEIGNADFAITPPTTNSTGFFTYVSSNVKVAVVNGNKITIKAIGNCTITATQAVTTNHIGGTITAPFIVNQVSPTIRSFIVPATKNVGDPTFKVVATSNSTSPFTYTSSNIAVVKIVKDVVTIVGAGTVVITAVQTVSKSFGTATVTATLVVNPTTTVLSNFPNFTKVIGNPAFAISSPTTKSNGAFTYTSSNPAVATFSGNFITIVGVGFTNITAVQASTANYTSATITNTLQVLQPTPQVGLLQIPNKSLDTPVFTIVDPTKPVNNTGTWTYTSSDLTKATVIENEVTLLESGFVTIIASLSSDSLYNSVTLMTQFSISEPGVAPSSYAFVKSSQVAAAVPANIFPVLNIVTLPLTMSTPQSVINFNPQPKVGTVAEMEANRSMVLNTLFNMFTTVSIINIPSTLIYMPSTINNKTIKSIKFVRTNGTTAETPFIINSIPGDNLIAFLCLINEVGNSVQINGFGANSGFYVKITKGDDEKYIVQKTNKQNFSVISEGLSGDMISYAALKIVIGMN